MPKGWISYIFYVYYFLKEVRANIIDSLDREESHETLALAELTTVKLSSLILGAYI